MSFSSSPLRRRRDSGVSCSEAPSKRFCSEFIRLPEVEEFSFSQVLQYLSPEMDAKADALADLLDSVHVSSPPAYEQPPPYSPPSEPLPAYTPPSQDFARAWIYGPEMWRNPVVPSVVLDEEDRPIDRSQRDLAEADHRLALALSNPGPVHVVRGVQVIRQPQRVRVTVGDVVRGGVLSGVLRERAALPGWRILAAAELAHHASRRW